MKHQKQFDLYNQKYEELMASWAQEVRDWANAEDRVFYMDGIFDPQTWFDSDFRPLFILKEVNEYDHQQALNEAADYRDKPVKNCINFVGIDDAGSDPWGAKIETQNAPTWNRLAILAKAMFAAYNNKHSGNEIKTSEKIEIEERRKICKQIAVINLKKLGGGENVRSKESRKTLFFESHATRFFEKLINQIDLISPTVIICCGKNEIIECLEIPAGENPVFESRTGGQIPIINGYHPQCWNWKNCFYQTVLEDMLDRGLFDKNEN